MIRVPSIVLSLLLAGALRAGAAPNPMPPAGVTTRVLANGATLIVQPTPGAPIAAVDLWIRAGSADDGASGAAHALEHMAFKGSKDAPNDRVDAMIETTGGILSAATLPDATHFWASCPPDQAAAVIAAIPMVLREPALDPAAWERERQVILEEIERSKTDLPAEARRTLSAKLYGTRGAPASGTSDAIRALTPDTIRAFQSRWYRADRVTMVVTGRVDTPSVLQAADAALSKIPRPGTPIREEVFSPVVARADVTLTNGGRAAVGMGFAAPAGPCPALDVACGILRNQLQGKLSGVADSVQVTHPWQRAAMVTVVAIGLEVDADRIRSTILSTASGLSASITEADVRAEIRARQHAWWLSNEAPVAQASSLGLAAALGDLPAATLTADRLGSLSLDDVALAATRAFGKR